ncbi:hypothetical protein [Shewanella woodyi]|uniref:Periplasmic protein n=1 Tax=Shewanella woodyi (strain ATCC 51908 / MS32) TaxID=392500 RepID=B1KJ99_SHEWM|nr:hypothetical protein [Shewanella woodyi]ACA88571.1 conserved hypothetical protein [Shewanella woodyi ATCC 51908]
MAKFCFTLLLFISLLGQYLLSPAMAMPNLLHSVEHSTEASSSTSKLNQPKLLCDISCVVLAGGHCVSHCISLVGIATPPSIVPLTSGKSAQNRALLWSEQTTDPTKIDLPPIANLAKYTI